MGQKTHPIGFRLGGVQNWLTRWYAPNGKSYSAQIAEDLMVRSLIRENYKGTGGVTNIGIAHDSNILKVSIWTTRPGAIIGRQGTRIGQLKKDLGKKTSKELKLDVIEVKQPDLSASHVAQSIAEQISARSPFRRTVKNSISRTMQAGAKGIKVAVKGRLGGAEIAREYHERMGRVPLHTLKSKIDFSVVDSHTTYGVIGVKVWIYKGDADPRVLPNEFDNANLESRLKK